MRKSRKILAVLMILCLTLCIFTACGDKSESAKEPVKDTVDLSGKTLQIYCGAGMTKPFEQISKIFKNETGCEMEVVYANAAQLQTQIKTTQQGDLFIAGSADELAPVKEYISVSKDLVKHIPVLAVKSGNPLEINGLNDLTKDGVKVVLGDGEATPIGKLSNKALTDLGILNNINIIARTTTAPEIFNALALGECDAIIVWKENVSGSDVEIVNTTDLDNYIKTVPAASLTFCKDKETLDAFLKFLDSNKAKDIWKTNGYEVLN